MPCQRIWLYLRGSAEPVKDFKGAEGQVQVSLYCVDGWMGMREYL